MKITYETKFDVFQKGNFKGSFKTFEEANGFLEKLYNERIAYISMFGNEDSILRNLNEQSYSILESKYAHFEK